MACIQKEKDKGDDCTILNIPDELRDEIRIILPKGKPPKTIGRPTVPFRKALDGVLCILRTGCQWKLLPAEHGSGSTCHRRFQVWVGLLQSHDDKQGIKWTWQPADSTSIKSPLGGGAMTGSNPLTEANWEQKGTI